MHRPLLSLLMLTAFAGTAIAPLASAARINVGIGANFGPPARAVEVAPAPRQGRVWAPGHWAWRHHRYVWVSGYWIEARPGYHYYPGRWAQEGPVWRFHVGYWGRIR